MEMRPVSIRTRLHRMIVWILTLSLVCTLLTWCVMLLIGQSRVNGENYYERMIPGIQERLWKEGGRVLDPAAASELDAVIPPEGFKYKVVDKSGGFLYGTYPDRSDVPPSELMERLNKVTRGSEHDYIQYVPLLDGHDQMGGALLLSYKLKVTPIRASDSLLVRAGVPLFLCIPFVYIVLFTILFVRRFDREIKGPLDQLITATGHIRQQDLHFTLTERGTITEIRDLTGAFERMRKELADSLHREWKLQKDRKEMIAALAHDIRTPLTVIQGHVEGLEEARRRNIDRFDRYLHVIKANVDRAVKLVRDLNQTAVLEQDSFQLAKVAFDPVEYLEEKAGEYESWCEKEGVRFVFQMTDTRETSGSPKLLADPDRLSQVLDNLVSNSLRFAERGEIQLAARIGGERLDLLLADNGPGFEPGKETEVFQAFYQGGTGVSRRKGHAGLGLYIAKTIVDKHGGEIAASRGEDGGAVVTVTLPMGEGLRDETAAGAGGQ